MRTQPVNRRSHVSRSIHLAADSSGRMQSTIDVHSSASVAANHPDISAISAISCANRHQCLMLLTIGVDCANQCRQLLMKTCGDGIVFIRTQPVAHAAKLKVWLGVNDAFTGRVMDAVMRTLPSAEFGRITHEPA